MPFKVIIADNSHYMDESENFEHGTFDSLDLAVAAAKRIVDQYLASAHRKGMSAAQLYRSYLRFGEDPYIVGVDAVSLDAPGVPFSAWDYARQRCRVLCSPGQPAAPAE